MNWYGFFNGVLIGPVIRRRVRATVIGREHLPKTGGCILAMGNHTTEVESVIVSAVLRHRQLHFYAKVEYWRQSGLKGRARRWFMDAIGDVPVDRSDSRKALEAIYAGALLLHQGEAMAVYPEGTRASDGKLHGAYPGTAYSVLQASFLGYEATDTVPHIPIIPVGLIGMERAASPKGGFWPQRCRVTIIIGEPIELSATEQSAVRHGYRNPEGRIVFPRQAKHAGQLSARMMDGIAGLCGKAYDPEKLEIPGGI